MTPKHFRDKLSLYFPSLYLLERESKSLVAVRHLPYYSAVVVGSRPASTGFYSGALAGSRPASSDFYSGVGWLSSGIVRLL